MELIDKYFRLNKFLVFTILVVAYYIVIFLSNKLLINDITFYNAYSDQLTYERSLQLFHNLKRLSWIGYVYIPVSFLFKALLVSVVIYSGIILIKPGIKVLFRYVWGIVIASEIAFVLAAILKFLWFTFFAGNYDLRNISFFYPLSLSNLFNYNEVDMMWVVPLQSLNLFQVLYFLLLSYGISKQEGFNKSIADKAILVSYLPGFFIWIAFLMFLSL